MKTTADSTYIGTKLPPPEHRQFGIRAASRGLSKAALMRNLALDFLAAEAAAVAKASQPAQRRATRPAGKRKQEVTA